MANAQKLLVAQSLVLLGGTVFAWANFLPMVTRFQGLYGTLTTLGNGVAPNPFLTPCFYGSFAFLLALLWSVDIGRRPAYARERNLRTFLLASSLFAAGSVVYEAAQYYHLVGGYSVSCIPGASPFATPCFYGTFFFLAAFAVAVVAARRLRPSGDASVAA